MHSPASDKPVVPRAGLTASIWGGLVLAVIAGTIPQFLWHVEFFKVAGDGYYRLLLVSLPVLFAAPLAYHWLRSRGLRSRGRGRWEPLLLAALALVPAIVREPRALLVMIAFTASCYAIGLLVLRACGITLVSVSTRLPVSVAAGTGIFSIVLFALGMAGAYRSDVFLALLVLPPVFGWRHVSAAALDIRQSADAWADRVGEPNPVISTAVLFLGIFTLITSLSAITPTTNGDAVRMHLSLMKIYFQSGALIAPPFLDYTYYPQGFEVLMTMLWPLGGQAAVQLLNPMHFAMTQLLAYGIGRYLGMSAPAALLGTVLAAMVPFLHWTGSVVKNDMVVVLYLLCALLGLLHWMRERSAGWIHLSVYFVASAFGVKHTALFGALPLGVLTLYALWSHRRWRPAVLAIVLLAVPPGIWYARTWRAKGNPLYPDVASSAILTRTIRVGFLWRVQRIVTMPWIVHFIGTRAFESPTPNPMGVGVLILLPLVPLVRSRGVAAPMRVCWFFIVTYLAYWSWILGMVRYAIAPILLMLLLLGERLYIVSRAPHRVLRFTAAAGLVYIAVFSTLVTVILEMYPTQPAWLAGRIDQREFLTAELRPFAAMDFLNDRAGPSDLILSIGAWSIYYASFPAQVNHVYRNERRYTAADVAELERRPYRFLILPSAGNLTELEQAATALRTIRLLHGDASFRVYEVQ